MLTAPSGDILAYPRFTRNDAGDQLNYWIIGKLGRALPYHFPYFNSLRFFERVGDGLPDPLRRAFTANSSLSA